MRRVLLLLWASGFGLAPGLTAQWGCKAMGPVLPVPAPEELVKGRTTALQVLADFVRTMGGGNVWAAQFHLQQAAQSTTDPAARYLLLAEAIAIAERAGDAAAALSAVGELAHNFGIDEREHSLATLARLRDGSPAVRVGAAMSALARAEAAMLGPQDTDMLRFFDAAVRCALLAENVAVYEYVRDRIVWLRGGREAFMALAGPAPSDAERRHIAAQLGGLLGGDANATLPLRDLAPVLPALRPEQLRADAPPPTAAEWRELARGARNDAVRLGLLRRACATLADGWHELDAMAQQERCRELTSLVPQLATARGVHALQFRTASDLDQLVRANGDWRVENGVLVGASKGANNFATHRLHFGAIRAVVVRGGIRSEAGLNFRVHVGDISLLLNWEVQPENHLWSGGTCLPKGPPALTVGKEHTIALFQAPGDRVHVCIDDVLWWSVGGKLAGTVTVYPALGSEIFVREILVDGDPAGVASAPLGQPM
jgi:hypothetical protein